MSVCVSCTLNKIIFNIGDYVYLKTDIDQYKRLVTGYTVRTDGILYLLSFIRTISFKNRSNA